MKLSPVQDIAMLFASVTFPVYHSQIWHSLAWIMSSNTVFSKHEKSLLPTYLSFGGRERKDDLGVNSPGVKGGLCLELFTSPLSVFPRFAFHAGQLRCPMRLPARRDGNSSSPVSPLNVAQEPRTDSACPSGQIASLSIKKPFFSSYMFLMMWKTYF